MLAIITPANLGAVGLLFGAGDGSVLVVLGISFAVAVFVVLEIAVSETEGAAIEDGCWRSVGSEVPLQ